MNTQKSPSPAIQPYLMFSGRCDEALEFYKKTLEAKIEMVMRFSESPDKPPEGMLAPGFENKIMHSSFQVRGTTICASDGCDEKTQFSGFSLSLSVRDEADANKVFHALVDGGSVQMPLSKTFWSPCFGMLTDKFGVSWMIIVPGEM